MEVKKYFQFINEAKKDDAKEEILKMLEEKPTVKMSNDNWPTEKGLYSQSGFIRHLKDKYTNHQVLNALHDIKNDKKIGLKHVMVKNYCYNESYPYYYLDITAEEANKIKDSYEEKNEVINKDAIEKRKESKKAAAKKVAEKKKPAKKVPAKKVPAKKVAAKKTKK